MNEFGGIVDGRSEDFASQRALKRNRSNCCPNGGNSIKHNLKIIVFLTAATARLVWQAGRHHRHLTQKRSAQSQNHQHQRFSYQYEVCAEYFALRRGRVYRFWSATRAEAYRI